MWQRISSLIRLFSVLSLFFPIDRYRLTDPYNVLSAVYFAHAYVGAATFSLLSHCQVRYYFLFLSCSHCLRDSYSAPIFSLVVMATSFFTLACAASCLCLAMMKYMRYR